MSVARGVRQEMRQGMGVPRGMNVVRVKRETGARPRTPGYLSQKEVGNSR
jgi:hypothetical protein